MPSSVAHWKKRYGLSVEKHWFETTKSEENLPSKAIDPICRSTNCMVATMLI